MPVLHMQSGYYSESLLFRVYMCETICKTDYTIKYISESHYQEIF